MQRLVNSFRYAFNGIGILAKTEANFKWHMFACVVVFCLAVFFKVSGIEAAILLLCCGGVMGAEAANTAIEKLADLYSTAHNPKIGAVKDLAAASVLLISLFALAIGLVIFIPKILDFA